MMTCNMGVPQRIAQHVRSNPDHLAIVDETQQISYQTLWQSAYSLSLKLSFQVPSSGPIVIYGQKSIECICAMLACLLAQKTYIPLEETQPIERLKYIFENSQVSLCLFHVKNDLRFPEEAINVKRIALRDLLDEKCIEFDLSESLDLDNHAFTLYTSGSTGVPKAVKFSQSNLLNFILWAQKTFQIKPEDRVASFAPLHFDLSTFDIFASLISGATIYLVPENHKLFPTTLTSWLNMNLISVIYMVPTALIALLKNDYWEKHKSHSLRVILFAGEPFALSEVLKLRLLYPTARIANLYGPTETNVCTWYEVPDAKQLQTLDFLPIGDSIDNIRTYLVDEKGNHLTEIDSVGELYCVGPSVSLGYLENHEHFFFENQQRAFKTGDIVRLSKYGWVFLHRKDKQIKRQGYRIDPSEIESCLRKHANVENAAIIIKNQQLIAFIESHVQPDNIEKTLHSLCQQYLPKIMHPDRYHFINELPKTSSGKIDYRFLLALELELI